MTAAETTGNYVELQNDPFSGDTDLFDSNENLLYDSMVTPTPFRPATRARRKTTNILSTLTSKEKWHYRLINVYIQDALNTRAPNKILQEPPSRNMSDQALITRVHAYKMSHDSNWSLFVYCVIWMHLGLIYWEPYAQPDHDDNDYPWMLFVGELLILAIYSINIWIRLHSHDLNNFWNSRWTKGLILVLAINFVELFGSFMIVVITGRTGIYRVSAVIRPYYLINNSKFLKATCQSIVRAVPRILDVLVLVVLYILMFAVLGYVLFSGDEMGLGWYVDDADGTCTNSKYSDVDTDCTEVQVKGNINFDSLFDAFISLCVLLTTANFPDVMMPSYHYSAWTVNFFIVFLVFGLYYLMSIIFAVVYHHYHEDNASFIDEMTENRAKALDWAFKRTVIVTKLTEIHNDNAAGMKKQHKETQDEMPEPSSSIRTDKDYSKTEDITPVSTSHDIIKPSPNLNINTLGTPIMPNDGEGDNVTISENDTTKPAKKHKKKKSKSKKSDKKGEPSGSGHSNSSDDRKHHKNDKNDNNNNNNKDSKENEIKSVKFKLNGIGKEQKLFENVDFNEERIYFSQFRIIMKMRRPTISERRIRILYNAMCQVKDRDLAVSTIDDIGIGITRDQWQNFYQYVNIEIFRDPKYAVETILDIGQEDLIFAEVINEDDMLYQDCCMKLCSLCHSSNDDSHHNNNHSREHLTSSTPGYYDNNDNNDKKKNTNSKSKHHTPGGPRRQSSTFQHGHGKTKGKYNHLDAMRWKATKTRICLVMCRNFWLKLWLGIRSILYRMFTHPILSALIDLSVWIGTIIVIMEISYTKQLETVSSVLVYIFVAEVTLRWIAFGRYFLKDTFNVLDFAVVYISWILDLFMPEGADSTSQASTNVIVAFRLLRFLRALATIERFKLIISTSVTVLSNLCILFSLEFCVFYVFAVIGLMIFNGTVTEEKALEQLSILSSQDDPDSDTLSFWTFIRDNYYYDNNMNYVSTTLVVLFELTVVNNWHVITRMYIELTSSWSYIYFYMFYFVSVLIVMNVLTAFIFDAFITQFNITLQEEQEREKKQRKLARKNQRKLRKIQRLKKQKEKKSNKKMDSKRNVLLINGNNTSIQNESNNNNNVFMNMNNSQSMLDVSQALNSSGNSTLHDWDGGIEKQSTFHIASDSEANSMLEEIISNIDLKMDEAWHKWVAVAMLFEFNPDDVNNGLWLYRRTRSKADFYETVYGAKNLPLIHWLKKWNEKLPKNYYYNHYHNSNTMRQKLSFDSAVFTPQESSRQVNFNMSNFNINNNNNHNNNNNNNGGSSGNTPSFAKMDLNYPSQFSLSTANLNNLNYVNNNAANRGNNNNNNNDKNTMRHVRVKSIDSSSTATALTDERGGYKQIVISGPKQYSIFDALSRAPKVGFQPKLSIANKKKRKKKKKDGKKLEPTYAPPQLMTNDPDADDNDDNDSNLSSVNSSIVSSDIFKKI